MTLHLTNARIVTPAGTVTGTLSCEDGVIVGVRDGPPSAGTAGEQLDIGGGYLLPGFIDTQVNGGAGTLLNDKPTVEGIAAIGRAHRAYGTTGYLPTLISDRLDIVDTAMRATEQAIAQCVPGVLGIHIEGPFISTERKGIHNPTLFRTLDAESKALLKSLKRGKTLVTLAPENCTPDDIAELSDAGVILSAGHTNATFETTRVAFASGVTGVTHLFNAMSPMTHRAPGVVGAALENQSVYCGLICDGRHVDWAVLRIALRTRPHDRFMLVTDAMPTVGSKTKTFALNGKHIHVEDGVCVDGNGTLAGSDLDMATAVRNTLLHLRVDVLDAAIMAATAPARFLGLDDTRGSLAIGKRADVVWMNGNFEVVQTFIATTDAPDHLVKA